MSLENKDEIESLEPLLYEKKLLPANKVQSLELQMQQLAAENTEVLSIEKIMLDNFIGKSDAFVSRLEEYLEAYKSQNVDTVLLTDAMVDPEADAKDGALAPENRDPLEKLRNWYPVVEEYVKTQHEKVQKLTDEWFDHLNVAFEVDATGAQTVKVKRQSRSDQKSEKNDTTHAVFWLLIILLTSLNIFLFYDSENVTSCTDEPVECFAKDLFDFVSLVYEKYLIFHNITFECEQQTPSLNNSIEL